MTDTRARFLRSIAGHMPPDHVKEVHLFRPMRQGGAETGVAVIAAIPTDAPVAGRHTVFTAHYRLALKGPDRGKWEVAITVDADAPLAVVDEVVRGVCRRAGDEEEPERLSGESFRAALSEEPWTASP